MVLFNAIVIGLLLIVGVGCFSLALGSIIETICTME